MSSKIPVSIPYRRDPKKFLTPIKENPNVSKTQSNEDFSMRKVLNTGNKYKHVTAKVSTHWSPEEKTRTGLKTFFQRKESKTTTYGSSLSPEIIRQVSRVKDRRLSLPVQMSSDPIGEAIESLKMSTNLSYSSCSSTNSSFVSLQETSTDQ